ncbi:hypothetical protein [Sphaerothrix gracilis]|uniref:hypothetical protein n=1 Tax=Sphaerothrix gracilis TaxID=3151835 RepID=UPI0031FE2158
MIEAMRVLEYYWTLITLTSSGDSRASEIPALKAFLENHFATIQSDSTMTDSQIQEWLLKVWQSDSKNSSLAQLCLRCLISHHISRTCKHIVRQFGPAYGFVESDIIPFVLDDTGKLDFTYRPFAVEILESFNPSRAKLPTWVVRRVRSHQELDNFLQTQGLYRVSDWAILNDTTVTQLQQILKLNCLSNVEIEAASKLLISYHSVYRQDRLNKIQEKSRQRCKVPTNKQLLEIDSTRSANDVLNHLQGIAQQLRQYRIYVRTGIPNQVITDPDIIDMHEESIYNLDVTQETAEAEFMQRYKSIFLTSLDETIEHVVRNRVSKLDEKRVPAGNSFMKALDLFVCQGLSMRNIAEQIGFKSQVQVTRLLRLKSLREEIYFLWLEKLKKQVKKEVAKYTEKVEINKIYPQLEEFLREDILQAITESSAEAQSPKRKEVCLFNRRLCKIVSSMKNPTHISNLSIVQVQSRQH